MKCTNFLVLSALALFLCGAAPNDPKYADQWYLQPERTVIVALIDSGIDTLHEDLAANLWVNPGEIADNGIDDDGNGYVDDVHGYDFVDSDGDPTDPCYGHGTTTAGVLGAVRNNGLGIAGAADGGATRIGACGGRHVGFLLPLAPRTSFGYLESPTGKQPRWPK